MIQFDDAYSVSSGGFGAAAAGAVAPATDGGLLSSLPPTVAGFETKKVAMAAGVLALLFVFRKKIPVLNKVFRARRSRRRR